MGNPELHSHDEHHQHNLELWIISIQAILLVMSEILPFCKGSKNGLVQGLVKIIRSDCLLTSGIPQAVELPETDILASCDCDGVEAAILEV